MQKFKVGQTVVINKKSVRLPRWIKDRIFVSRHRIVTGVYFDRGTQHTHYHLGYNGRGVDLSIHDFRASELKPYKMKPHTRRIKTRICELRVS